MKLFKLLSREERQEISLLQIGTFLEYFDLMLYVHMAVVLNNLFFEKSDPHTMALLSAFAFCSTYLLRPFGAILFGWIGDTIGRKTTIVITTLMMFCSCLLMGALPTYNEIGIMATWMVIICRMIQSLSSLGEMMGAEIYATESIKPPLQYPIVSYISIAGSVGGTFALAVASLVTHFQFNWRWAFFLGAGVAFIGTFARTVLRETKEFIDAKEEAKLRLEKNHFDLKTRKLSQERLDYLVERFKSPFKTQISYFFAYCGWPVSFYLAYMYFNPTLKSFGYTPPDIVTHNLYLSIVLCFTNYLWAKLSYTIPPLKILKYRIFAFCGFGLILPILIQLAASGRDIFLIQCMILFLSLGVLPADSIFLKGFSVLKRFTQSSWLYAWTRSIMYLITTFGLIFLNEWMGHYGLWVLFVFLLPAMIYGINYFQSLENQSEEREFQEEKVLDRLNGYYDPFIKKLKLMNKGKS